MMATGRGMPDKRQELSGCRVHDKNCLWRHARSEGSRDVVCTTMAVDDDMVCERDLEMPDARQELSGCCVYDKSCQ
jgi:hypothetical protein